MPIRRDSIKKVKANYRKTIEDIAGNRTQSAVYAILSQGSAMAATMTPVDTSNLINSAYAPQFERHGTKTIGHVGYTALYASAVHNAKGILSGLPRANGNGQYWDPSGEPKFLEKGFEEIRSSIPAILKGIYRV